MLKVLEVEVGLDENMREPLGTVLSVVNNQSIKWMIKQTVRSESTMVIYKVSDWVSVIGHLWMWQAIHCLISDCCQRDSCCACLLSARRTGQEPHLHQTIFKGLEGRSESYGALGKPVRELVSGASLSVASPQLFVVVFFFPSLLVSGKFSC